MVNQKVWTLTDAKCLGALTYPRSNQLKSVYTKPGMLSSHLVYWSLSWTVKRSHWLLSIWNFCCSNHTIWMCDVDSHHHIIPHFRNYQVSLQQTLVVSLDCIGPPLKQESLFERWLSWPNSWKSMMVSTSMFSNSCVRWCLRGQSHTAYAAPWSNRLAPAICSYVSRIPQIHTYLIVHDSKEDIVVNN